MTPSLTTIIEQRLAILAPTQLHLVDNSAAHAGHKGNTSKGAHFVLSIASTQFDKIPQVTCHQLIYQQVADLIPFPIHALTIKIIR